MNEFSQHLPAAQQVRAYARLRKLLASKDPRVVESVRQANENLARCKSIAGTVHTDSALTNLSVQYRNEGFIGTQLLPIVMVAKASGIYYKYSKRDRLAAPEDSVMQRSMPNEITENRTIGNYNTSGYALMDFVSENTLKNQDAPLDEMVDLIAAVNDAMDLREEKRCATVLTTAANFAGNTTTLSGTSQWSDYTSGVSNPIADIELARDACWSGPGNTKLVGYCGLAVYNILRHHPKVEAAFKHTDGLKGVNRQQLAEYFELDDILVSKAWEDTANEGQNPSYSRMWGKFFGVVRVAENPGIRSAGFGYTFRHGERKTTEWYDPKPGTEGGYYGKVGVEEGHVVVAPDTGFLIVNAVA